MQTITPKFRPDPSIVARLANIQNAASPRRLKVFRIIATMMAASGVLFGAFTAVFGIVSEAQRMHGFHNAVVASLLLVLAAPAAIAAARAPERAAAPLVHLIALSAAGLGTMVLGRKVDVFTLPFVVFVGVLIALRVPRFDRLVPGHWSPLLAGLVAVAIVPLLAYAFQQAELQRIDTVTEHAHFNHWVEMSFVAVAVLALGALTALRPTAFRLSAWAAGLTVAILGAASMALPTYASAIRQPWKWAALVGGVAFVGLAELERRRLGRADP